MIDRYSDRHLPVMLMETIDALDVFPGGRYIDATVGEGGHSIAIAEKASPGGQVLGIDADPEACSVASARLGMHGSSVLVANENFAELRAIARRYDFMPVHGILFDLGMSSLQLDREARGFSFRRPDPLDMRFSMSGGPTASDIVNGYSESALADLIYRFGEERFSRRIAAAIVKNRPVSTSMELAQIVAASRRSASGGKHPATQTFQALRIAVNDELQMLETALDQALSMLGRGARLVVISYHSLEDRIVKNFMRREAADCICPREERVSPICTCRHKARLSLVINGALSPSSQEIRSNRRSRSAKLRVGEKI